MALDAIFLKHIKTEIEKRALGGRVEKIYQPNRDELVIGIRTYDESLKLLVSARPDTARVHFTETTIENPKTPPMLCMLLRKKLLSSKLIGVEQKGLERVLVFKFDAVNELGDHVILSLATEIMGKYSNIILINEENKIIDSLKRVDADMSAERVILPGLLYRDPPKQEKLSLFENEPEFIVDEIMSLNKTSLLSKALMEKIQGISPIISRELEYQVGLGFEVTNKSLTKVMKERLIELITELKNRAEESSGHPYMVLNPETGKPMDFAFMPICYYENLGKTQKCESFSELLDLFYSERDKIERMRVKSADILKLLSNSKERLSRKINNQKAELEASVNREELRIMGDLISANLYNITQGQSEITVMNFYDENCGDITIKLNPAISPHANAQKYYKDYKKAKNAEQILTGLIKDGEKELDYIDSVFYSLQEAETEQDLNEIRQELYEQGYIKRQQTKGNKKPDPIGKPLKFTTEDGFTILVGRNNKQNDKLTLKDARNSDYWFHTKNIHGSHVILVTEGREPSESAMFEACKLAAKHSKAKESSQIPVDYCLVKNVSKPQGSKPGMVIYVNYKTAYVNSDLIN